MFRFTIRELVLVTVIVALASGWWLDHARLEKILAAGSWIGTPELLEMRPGKKVLVEMDETGAVTVKDTLNRP